MRKAFAVSVICVIATAAVAAGPELSGPEAAFLGQRTYAVAADCPKFKRTAQFGAAAKALESLPKTLSAKGYVGPDESCRFTNIDERYAGRLWTVSMACSSGAAAATNAATPPREELRSQVWRKQADGSFMITEVRDAKMWLACAPDKPVAPPAAVPAR